MLGVKMSFSTSGSMFDASIASCTLLSIIGAVFPSAEGLLRKSATAAAETVSTLRSLSLRPTPDIGLRM